MVNAEGSRRVYFRNKSPDDFNIDEILRLRDTLIKAPNSDWISKVLLVQLLTGARFIEVLAISEFLTTDDVQYEGTRNFSDVIIFRVAKDKYAKEPDPVDGNDGPNIDDSDKKLVERGMVISSRILAPKPVLFKLPVQYVQCLVYDVIRPAVKIWMGKNKVKKTDELLATKLTNAHNSTANAALRKIIKRMKGTHTMRKIYANYSYDTLADKSMTRNAWISDVLGHRPTSVTTSISYQNVRVVLPPPQKEMSLEDKTTEIYSMISNLKREMKSIREDMGVFNPPSSRKRKQFNNDEEILEEGNEIERQLAEKGLNPTAANFQSNPNLHMHGRKWQQWKRLKSIEEDKVNEEFLANI